MSPSLGDPGGRTLAARLREHGAPLVLEDVPLAEPGPDEVVVDLQFAGINPIDRYHALGRVAAQSPLPRTLGSEASGLLDGRLVVVNGAGVGSVRDGVYARRVVVPREAVSDVPEGVDVDVAAAVAIAGNTAVAVVDLASVGAGDRVLVLGAGGGVGLPIVSYATNRGAQVWGQVGTSSKSAAVRAAGAVDVVVASGETLVERGSGIEPSVVIDALGGSFTPAALSLLAPGGRCVVYGTSAGAEVRLNWQDVYRKGLRILGYGGLALTAEERRAGIDRALRAVARGELRIPIGRSYPLSEVNEAFRALADREVTGKVLLDLR